MANEDLKQAESRTEGQTVDPTSLINQEPSTPQTEGKEVETEEREPKVEDKDNTGEEHTEAERNRRRNKGENV